MVCYFLPSSNELDDTLSIAAWILQGTEELGELVQQAQGRITILAGCGVNAVNVAALVSSTGVVEVHSSAKLPVESSMQFRHPHLTMCATTIPSDWQWAVADRGVVAAIVKALQGA